MKCALRVSSSTERLLRSGAAARTWGRAKTARKKYTALNTIETIWYGFERVGSGKNRALTAGTLFDVAHLYWKESSAGGWETQRVRLS